MRFLKYLLFLLLMPMMGFINRPTEEGIKWESWNTGYPRANKEKKIVLVDAYTAWCGWCKKMDADTYTDPEVIKTINKYFVPVKFNPELADIRYELNGQTFSGAELLMMLSNNQRLGYPTTYFIITTKNRLVIQPGYMKPVDFNQLLTSIVNEATSTN